MSNPKINKSDFYSVNPLQENNSTQENEHLPNALALLSSTPTPSPLRTSTSSECASSHSNASNLMQKQSAEEALREFLKSVKTDSSTICTHTAFSGSCLGVVGPFNIPPSKR